MGNNTMAPVLAPVLAQSDQWSRFLRYPLQQPMDKRLVYQPHIVHYMIQMYEEAEQVSVDKTDRHPWKKCQI